MSELIDRQAAIEAIEQMQMPIMRSEFPEEQFVFTGMSEALQAIKDLPSAQPDPSQVARDIATIIENEQDMMVIERNAQQWIPCSERLPEKYGNYLVTTDDGEVDIGSCDPENKDRQDHFWGGCDADGFFWYGENIVIAWMPLPKSYMRGEQDEND